MFESARVRMLLSLGADRTGVNDASTRTGTHKAEVTRRHLSQRIVTILTIPLIALALLLYLCAGPQLEQWRRHLTPGKR